MKANRKLTSRWITSQPRIKTIKLFNLELDCDVVWTLAENRLIDPPLALKRNLQDVQYVSYYQESEATCRISIDIMLVQCRKYLLLKHEANIAASNIEGHLSTPTRAEGNKMRRGEERSLGELFPDSSLCIDIYKSIAL